MPNDSKLKKLLGKGQARKAGEDVSLRKRYNRAASQAAARGESVPTFEEWKQQRNQESG